MQAQRKITKFNPNHRSRGSAADVFWCAIEEHRQRILLTLQGSEMGAHEDVLPLYGEVRRGLDNIRGLNEQQRKHGYNPRADDGIVVLAQAVRAVLNYPQWEHENDYLVDFMREASEKIALYARQRQTANG